MLVKIKRKAIDLNVSVGGIGSVQSFPQDIALLLIANGRAEEVEEPKKEKPKEVEPEVKTAVVKKPRKRPVKK